MTLDDETLMAYADGELDPAAAARVEQAIAQDPALAQQVARERALRGRLSEAFAPIAAEPAPATLTARLATNVIPFSRPAPARRWWPETAAIAATFVVGVTAGREWQSAPLTVDGDRLVARGALVAALDRDLSGGAGTTRMMASFRATDGGYCRIFETAAVDGIACRANDSWTVRQAQSTPPAAATAYTQAASPVATLMAEAQNMMAGAPLDARAERAARDRHWASERPSLPKKQD